ncbi:MAG: hypothetical protein WCK90_04725 [archaeon]
MTSLEAKTDYIICPVRNVTPEVVVILDDYVRKLEAIGRSVHYPPRDVEQDLDPIGIRILLKHRDGMKRCKRVHLYWNGKSEGSFSDFGMALMTDNPIFLINRSDVEKMATPGKKSFPNVFLYLDEQARIMYGNPLAQKRE